MLELKNLRPWEKVKIILKRHWIVFLILSVYLFIWIIISICLYIAFWFWFISNILNVVFWLFFWVFLYIEWLDHELDMYIVTNNRIVWVEQISFLNRTVSECNLWQVQEVNSRTKWFFANMFNYWTLSIQTAWNITTMKMDFCPDVIQRAREVLNIVDEFWENIPDKIKRKWKELA